MAKLIKTVAWLREVDSLQLNGGHAKEVCVEKEGQLSWKDGCLLPISSAASLGSNNR